MSSNHPDSNIPNFEPVKLPDFVLKGMDEKDKYIYDAVSKIDSLGKTIEWVAEQQVKQNEVLARIDAQVQKTNGRTTQNEKDIVEMKHTLEPWNRENSEFWNTIHTFSKKKWTWVIVSFCLCFFAFGVVPFVNQNGGISEFLGSAVKYIFE